MLGWIEDSLFLQRLLPLNCPGSQLDRGELIYRVTGVSWEDQELYLDPRLHPSFTLERAMEYRLHVIPCCFRVHTSYNLLAMFASNFRSILGECQG